MLHFIPLQILKSVFVISWSHEASTRAKCALMITSRVASFGTYYCTMSAIYGIFNSFSANSKARSAAAFNYWLNKNYINAPAEIQPLIPLHMVKSSTTEFYNYLTELNSCGSASTRRRRWNSSQLKYGPLGAIDESNDRNANFKSSVIHRSRKM